MGDSKEEKREKASIRRRRRRRRRRNGRTKKEQEKAVGWARFEPTQEKLVIFQVTRQALRC